MFIEEKAKLHKRIVDLKNQLTLRKISFATPKYDYRMLRKSDLPFLRDIIAKLERWNVGPIRKDRLEVKDKSKAQEKATHRDLWYRLKKERPDVAKGRKPTYFTKQEMMRALSLSPSVKWSNLGTSGKSYNIRVRVRYSSHKIFKDIREWNSTIHNVEISNLVGVKFETRNSLIAFSRYLYDFLVYGWKDSFGMYSEMYDDWDDIEILSVEQYYQGKSVGIKDIKKVPLFRCSYNWGTDMGDLTGSDTGMCVYDFLTSEYKLSVEFIENFLQKDKSMGITLEELERIADYLNVSIYISDIVKNTVISKTSKRKADKARNTQAMVGIVHDDHYFSLNKWERTGFINSLREGCQGPTKSNKSDKSDKVKCKVEYLPLENLDDKYREIVNTEKMIYPISVDNGKVMSIKIKDKMLVASKSIEKIKNIDIEDKTFNGIIKTIQAEAESKFGWKKSNLNDEIKKLIDKDLINKTPLRASNSKEFKDCETENMVKKAIDIRRCYASVCLKYDFFIVDSYSYPIEVSDLDFEVEDFKIGFYYIESDNIFNFTNKFYHYQLVAKLLEGGYIKKSDIKYYLEGRNIDGNRKYLDYCVNRVYGLNTEDCIKKDLVNIMIGKLATRCENKISKTIISTKEYFTNFYENIHKNLGRECKVFRFELGDTDETEIQNLYFINHTQKTANISTNIITQRQIIDLGNLRVIELYEDIINKIGGIPYSINTDCVYYYISKDVSEEFIREKMNIPSPNLPIQIGAYRIESVNGIFDRINTKRIDYKFEPREKNIVKYPNEYLNYEDVLKYDRCHISGFAGSGKSFVIKKMKEDPRCSKYVFMCFTNTASNNIDGKTIHNTFKVNPITNISTLLTHYDPEKLEWDGIVIDEINQMPIHLFNHLIGLLMARPDIKLYTFGDIHQEMPVDLGTDEWEKSNFSEYSILNSVMFNELIYGNYVELTKQCRSDEKFANACIKYHNDMEARATNLILDEDQGFLTLSLCDILKDKGIVEMTDTFCKEYFNDLKSPISVGTDDISSIILNQNCAKINITKTNKTAILINYHLNMKMVKEAKSRGEKTIYLKSKLLNFHLYKGLPVISAETNKQENYVKNMLLTVISYDEKKVELQNRSQGLQSNSISLPIDNFKDNFTPAYAFTTFKAEGMTIDENYTIWEFNRMGWKKRYTAMTRATDSRNINIVNVILKKGEYNSLEGTWEYILAKKRRKGNGDTILVMLKSETSIKYKFVSSNIESEELANYKQILRFNNAGKLHMKFEFCELLCE
jgi:hypothetical protein